MWVMVVYFLFDGNGGWNVFDKVIFGFVYLVQKLVGIVIEIFYVVMLFFGIEGVESE